MQAAADIMIAAFATPARIRDGMMPATSTRSSPPPTSRWAATYDGGLVLIGEATAYPHGSEQAAACRKGAIVLFDCSCSVHGYQSDISRTYVFGADADRGAARGLGPDARGQQIAFAAAKLALRRGASTMRFARTYESWGYGPGYKLPGTSHRTGHGIGMEGHEPVNLVHGETTPLAAGMCFSNEPGIYIPGKFGVRLEDCFHMTATARNVSACRRHRSTIRSAAAPYRFDEHFT